MEKNTERILLGQQYAVERGKSESGTYRSAYAKKKKKKTLLDQHKAVEQNGDGKNDDDDDFDDCDRLIV